MHAGRDRNKSNTEAMCHPPSHQECREQKEEVGEMSEEALFTAADGCITFARKLKCLGSWTTQDLRDDTDIKARVGKANVSKRWEMQTCHDGVQEDATHAIAFEHGPVGSGVLDLDGRK
jgi:hypothetical protein